MDLMGVRELLSSCPQNPNQALPRIAFLFAEYPADIREKRREMWGTPFLNGRNCDEPASGA